MEATFNRELFNARTQRVVSVSARRSFVSSRNATAAGRADGVISIPSGNKDISRGMLYRIPFRGNTIHF